MKWLEIFKVYSLKKIKEQRILFVFTVLSVLISTSISIIIPIINLETRKYMENNIKEINGGDLSININGEKKVAFKERLDKLKKEGADIKNLCISNGYFLRNSNNIMGSIVIGEYGLKEDEIIIQGGLANTLKVKVGDYIQVDTCGNGKFKYKVKGIDSVSSGVDRDAELLGYGKIEKKNYLNGITGREMILIDGINGTQVKEELNLIDNSNGYTSLKDKKDGIKDELFIQKSSLGILSSVGYIFSIIAIISTSIMLIIKRKKDIAILKILAIDKREIKRAIGMEISLWLLIPIFISGVLSYYGAKLILNMSGIEIAINRDILNLIFSGLFFNGVLFLILINIILIMVNGIDKMAILREDERLIKKAKRKIAILSIIMIIGVLIGYGLYFKCLESLGSSLIIVILIVLFLGFIVVAIKILSIKKFKSSILMYTIKDIKARLLSFIVVILSLSMTLWFILIGFSLESSIKDTFKNSFKEILPYDYYVETKENKEIDEILNSQKDVEGYIKISDIDGKVVNEKFNNTFRNVVISEVNEKDYELKYKILQGENLFTGKEKGVIISDNMREMNSLDIGDILEIETKEGIIKEEIKGIYESGGINTLTIFKEEVKMGNKLGYYIKSEKGDFIDKLTESYVINVSSLGERMGASIGSFMKIFRILSIVCILGTVIFNVNMVYMNYIEDEKEEEIIRALGLGKSFFIKSQIIKMGIILGISIMLSLGTFFISITLFFKMMINRMGSISNEIIIINILIGLIICTISYIYPLKEGLRKKELNLLREGN